MKEFADLFLENGVCFVWLQLEPGGEDLYPAMLGDGPRDDHWLEYELSSVGWECLLDPNHVLVEGNHGWGYRFTWATWALKQGIAPCQPFLLFLEKPRYFQCNSYFDPVEYDVEYSWELLYVQPLSPGDMLERWEEWEKDWLSYFSESEQAMAEFRKRRAADVGAMYIRSQWYFGPKDSWWDEMQPPNGLQLAVCSKHTSPTAAKSCWPELLIVREDDGWGRSGEAWRRLKERAMQELGLTEEQFDSLPMR